MIPDVFCNTYGSQRPAAMAWKRRSATPNSPQCACTSPVPKDAVASPDDCSHTQTHTHGKIKKGADSKPGGASARKKLERTEQTPVRRRSAAHLARSSHGLCQKLATTFDVELLSEKWVGTSDALPSKVLAGVLCLAKSTEYCLANQLRQGV